MRKEQRLINTKDFAATRREGKSWSNRHLVLIVRPNGLDVSRVGFSVGKRVGGAVVRNRVKRRVREAVRLAETQMGWDILLIGRKYAASADYHTLRLSALGLLDRAGILNPPEEHRYLPSEAT